MKTLFRYALMLFTSIGLAHASQEGILPLGSFSMSSPGIDRSGPVTVSGQAKEKGITSLQVVAFGKTRVLNAEQLKQLGEVFANGIQLSYEHGYTGHGGRTVYIIFSRAFTSGQTTNMALAVDEEGGIRIIQPERSSKP